MWKITILGTHEGLVHITGSITGNEEQIRFDAFEGLLGKYLGKNVGFTKRTVGFFKFLRHPISGGIKGVGQSFIDILKYYVEVEEMTRPQEQEA